MNELTLGACDSICLRHKAVSDLSTQVSTRVRNLLLVCHERVNFVFVVGGLRVRSSRWISATAWGGPPVDARLLEHLRDPFWLSICTFVLVKQVKQVPALCATPAIRAQNARAARTATR